MRIPRIVATTVAAVVLVTGAGIAGAAEGTPRPTADARAGYCAQLQGRVAQTPGIQDRIANQIDLLEQQIDRIANPQRQAEASARLQPRIDKLEELSARLAQQTALAQRLCGARRT